MSATRPSATSGFSPTHIEDLRDDEVEVDVPADYNPPAADPASSSTLQKVINFIKAHKETLGTMTFCAIFLTASITLCAFGQIPLAAAIVFVTLMTLSMLGGVMNIQEENRTAEFYSSTASWYVPYEGK